MFWTIAKNVLNSRRQEMIHEMKMQLFTIGVTYFRFSYEKGENQVIFDQT